MIKLTPRNRVPLVIAAAVAAILTAGQTSQAAVDEKITVGASQAVSGVPIEQIGAVAVDYAGQIGRNEIKLNPGNLEALARIITSEIASKVPSSEALGAKDPNRDENKGDEIGEMVALIANGVTSNLKFSTKGAAAAVGLAKGALLAIKKNKTVQQASSPNIFQDVAGSIMLTFRLNQTSSAATDKAIFSLLKRSVVSIVGQNKGRQLLFKTGLKEAFKGDIAVASLTYEDGANGPVIDPETDTRKG